MDRRPVLELFVSDGCEACKRAERVVRSCEGLAASVSLAVRHLDDPAVDVPAAVIGGPTLVFRGVVVSLGTPDCARLAERIERLMAEPARE